MFDRQGMAHALDDKELGAWDRVGCRLASLEQDQGVGAAVDNKRRRADRLERLLPAFRCQDGGQLTGDAGRIEAAVEVASSQLQIALFVDVVSGPAQDALIARIVLDVPLAAGAGVRSTDSASVLGGGSEGSPVDDMIEVSVRTLSAWWIAISWAMEPPIDMPTTCARSIPRESRRPAASAAMSASV
jgi:hypothetical protein